MKLCVTETSEDILSNKKFEKKYFFNFINNNVVNKLQYVTLFKAIMDENKNVKISLIRQIHVNEFEEYESKEISLLKDATFYDKSQRFNISINFKLVK